ncbi:MAG: MFS transporter [Chloroflexi bacterium]|nr:MFS transporter [Chloroflexota bacterium]
MRATLDLSRRVPERWSASWITVWLLSAGAFTVNLDSRSIVPLLPSLAEDLNVSVAVAGLVATAYMLPYGAFQLVYGPLADRIGRLQVALLALLGFAIGTTACGFVTSFEMLVVTRFLTGATAAAVFPMGLTYIGDAFEYRERPAALGVLITASSMAQLMSLALGGILAGFVSWRAIFFLDGFLAFLVVVALVSLRGPEPSRQHGGTLAGYRAVARSGRALLVPLLALLEGILLYGGLTYLGAFLRDRWELGYAAIGLALALYGAGNVVASRLLSWLAARLNEPRRFLLGGIMSVTMHLAMAALPYWEAMPVLMFILGFGFVSAHSVLQARATEIAPTARGTSVAVFACALFFGGAIGTAAVGAAIEVWNYERVLAGLGLALVPFCALGWFGLRTPPRRQPA